MQHGDATIALCITVEYWGRAGRFGAADDVAIDAGHWCDPSVVFGRSDNELTICVHPPRRLRLTTWLIAVGNENTVEGRIGGAMVNMWVIQNFARLHKVLSNSAPGKSQSLVLCLYDTHKFQSCGGAIRATWGGKKWWSHTDERQMEKGSK